MKLVGKVLETRQIPWIGPDVQELTRTLFNEKGYKTFVYVPVGFVSDHLEVLFDNDFECKVVCDQLGASYYRPEMPNCQPEFIDALSTVVLNKVSFIKVILYMTFKF